MCTEGSRQRGLNWLLDGIGTFSDFLHTTAPFCFFLPPNM